MSGATACEEFHSLQHVHPCEKGEGRGNATLKWSNESLQFTVIPQQLANHSVYTFRLVQPRLNFLSSTGLEIRGVGCTNPFRFLQNNLGESLDSPPFSMCAN